MTKPSDQYFAGLFDGEGWFHINRHAHAGRRPSFQVHAGLAVRQKNVVVALKKEYGGSVRLNKPANTKHSDSWRWDACGEHAAAFATFVLPHLRIKERQAKLTIGFQAFKRLNKNSPNSTTRHKQLERMYTRMKQLNKRGR